MPAKPPISRIKAPALRPGDTIGVIAPASNIRRELLDAGCEALHRLGYKTLYSDSIFEQDLYFAGSVERRVRELEDMFERPEVRAVICARGGYGANFLLNAIDLKKIRSHPKIFIGYSDITTLLTYLADAIGLVTFHGPMVTKDFARSDGVDPASWEGAVRGVSQWAIDTGPNSGVRPLVEGNAEGILYGGCLSMLSASLGTPYEIHTAGSILFIEDVATKPYQIDRMLMQLKLAGKLDDIRGIVFGEMLDCVQKNDQDYALPEVLLRVVGQRGIPIVCGLRSGHVSRQNVTLPIGVSVALRVSSREVQLKILEPATTTRSMHAREIS